MGRGKKPWKPYGQLVELDITGLSADGLGLATLEGYAYSVFTALPGDRIRARIIGRDKGVRKAVLEEVLQPSPHRVEAFCPAYGACGGCSWQALDYSAQVRALDEQVRAMMSEHGVQLDATTWRAPHLAPEQRYYRGKIELTWGGTPEALVLGFHRKGQFNRLVDVPECAIGPPVNGEVITRVRAWAQAQQHTAYEQRSHSGFLRNLVIRQNRAHRDQPSEQGPWLAALVTTTPSTPDWGQEALLEAFADLPGGTLLHVVSDTLAGAIVVDQLQVLRGDGRLHAYLGDVRYDLGLQSFFQSNQTMADRLLAAILDAAALTGRERVLDLYCGVGTIALALARQAAHVTGVEFVPEAIADAQRNAQLNGISNVELLVGAAEKYPLDPHHLDLIVLDPPRSGLHPKLVERLLAQPHCRVIYVSCNPRALAADLSRLQAVFAIESIQCFDLFAQTPHVETLVTLRPRPPHDRDPLRASAEVSPLAAEIVAEVMAEVAPADALLSVPKALPRDQAIPAAHCNAPMGAL
jgi:23S rRNA (uracil1939-C5)-methyltransferase